MSAQSGAREFPGKRELHWIYGRHTWPTRDLLRSVLFDYVEGFYNPQRTQKRLGFPRPSSKQRQWLKEMCAQERVNTTALALRFRDRGLRS